jgi:uncharacterized protein
MPKINQEIEMRFLPIEKTELRAVEANGNPVLEGYAAVFNVWMDDEWWGFRENIARGAFAETIKSDNVRVNFNHDPNHVLGTTLNQTLTLREDDHGLFQTTTINPDDPDAMSVYSKVKRGDVRGQSFAFQVEELNWKEEEGKVPERTLVRVKLFDVGPVTFPAYEQTDVTAAKRSLEIYRQNHGPARGGDGQDRGQAQGRGLDIIRHKLILRTHQFGE